MRLLVLVCLGVHAVSAFASDAAPANLVVDGIPPIPPALKADTGRYLEFRTAAFQSWHPVHRELVVLLNSPVVKADKKDRILDQVFAAKVGQLTAAFMGVLVRKGRERLLPDVAAAFNELYKIHKNIVVAQVASAVPLNETARW